MDILVITHALNGVLMVAMPVSLAILLSRRWDLGWSAWFIGAATFILSQVGHIPFNWAVDRLLEQSGLVYWTPVAQLIVSALFLGLSAGLFEEVSRYLVLRFWLKDARSWRSGVFFGAGHGGAEAIILGLLVVLTFVNMMLLRNADLAGLVPADQLAAARQQVEAYWTTPWPVSLLGALERLLTIPCHIFMALLVQRSVIARKVSWLLAAIGFHALIDGVAVAGRVYLSAYLLEGLLAFFTLFCVFMIIRMKPGSEAV
ncbi:MAG: YhfC family intramembrane metalloprotease [Chloroflexi bacterium]|nr:YhfC family intramembrane metalloprotease [Chloroflexota bacterium]